MKLPLLVHASPRIGLRNSTEITPGRWRVDIEGKVHSSFHFLFISPVFPEGFEPDIDDNPEFYVSCRTKVVCRIVHVGGEKSISIYLRKIADGIQYHSDAERVKSSSG